MKLNNELLEFYNKNQEFIEESFDEHISGLEDSSAHIRMVSNSDDYFWEFVEELKEELDTTN